MMPFLIGRQATPERRYHEITLDPSVVMGFNEHDDAFIALKEAIKAVSPDYPIRINLTHLQQISAASFSQCIDFLLTMPFAYDIGFFIDGVAPAAMKEKNDLLSALYSHITQQKIRVVHIAEASKERPSVPRRVRRAKQLLNKGELVPIQMAHHYHQQQELSQDIVQDTTQQVQQQLAETRSQQIQQQQQRLQQLQHDSSDVNADALGLLLHEGNLQEAVTSTCSLDEIKRVWFGLVGNYASKVDDPRNRITHVPIATFRLIMEHQDQFRNGVLFDDLANGFGFLVREKEQDGTTVSQSILYYDNNRVEKSDDKRQDSLLAARLAPPLAPQTFGTVGQFYPFFSRTPFNEADYHAFVAAHQSSFTTLVSPSRGTSCRDRMTALSHVMQLSEPDFNETLLHPWVGKKDHHTLDGFCSILLDKGGFQLQTFLNQLESLKKSELYDDFKRFFMDTTTDWRDFVSTERLRRNELTGSECLAYVLAMPATEKNWWQHMIREQAKTTTHPASFVDLVNAHRYFFAEVKAIDPELRLPTTCPLGEVRDMKATYARLLYVLKKAIVPQEQVHHLEKLDFGMQGVICGASRLGSYSLVSSEMVLTAESSILDWEKLRRYAPTLPEIGEVHFFGGSYAHKRKEDPLYHAYHGKKYLPSEEEVLASLSEEEKSYVEDGVKQYQSFRQEHHLVKEWFFPTPFYTFKYDDAHRRPDAIKADYRSDGDQAFGLILSKSGRIIQKQIICDYYSGDKTLNRDGWGRPFSYLGQHSSFKHFNIKKFYANEEMLYQKRSNYGGKEFWVRQMDYTRDNTSTMYLTDALLKIYAEVGHSYDANEDEHCEGEVTEFLIGVPRYDDPDDDLSRQGYRRNGFLIRIKTIRYQPITLEASLEDDVFMARKGTLAYDINASELLEASQRLHLFSNFAKYVYRFIGTQTFTFPFQHYMTAVTHMERTVTGDDAKQVLLLFVLCRTGSRALKDDRDALTDMTSLTTWVTDKPTCSSLLMSFNTLIHELPCKPTLHEATVILSLCQRDPMLDEDSALLKRFFNAVQAHGETVYLATTHLSQRSDVSHDVWRSFITAIETLPTSCDVHQKNVLLLFSAVLIREDHSRLAERFEAVSRLSPAVLLALESLLKRLSVTSATALMSVDTMTTLLEQLAAIPADATDTDTLVLGTLMQACPSFQFTGTSLTVATAFFMRNMVSFKRFIAGLFATVEGISSTDGSVANIDSLLRRFKTTLKSELTTLQALMDALSDSGDSDVISQILQQIQVVMLALEPPASVELLVLKPLFDELKAQTVETLSRCVSESARAFLSDSVVRMSLKDAKLAETVSHFLQSRLPSLTGKNTAVEIPALLSTQKTLEGFVGQLKSIDSHPRERLLAYFDHCGYYQTPDVIPMAALTGWLASVANARSINPVSAVTTLFEAHSKGIALDVLQSRLDTLLANVVEDDEFQALLNVSVAGTFPLEDVIALQNTRNKEGKVVLFWLLDKAHKHPQVDLKPCVAALTQLCESAPESMALLADYLRQEDNEASVSLLLDFLNKEVASTVQAAALNILRGACWTRKDAPSVPLSQQINVIRQLMQHSHALTRLGSLYDARPCPRLSALEDALKAPSFRVGAFIQGYECDPFGHRKDLEKVSELRGVDSFIAEIKTLGDKPTPLLPEVQQTLKEYVSYIVGVGLHYGLSVGEGQDEQIKPLCQFNRVELQIYYEECIKRAKANPKDIQAQLDGLAVLCEVLFRTTGKYPYPSQIISVLNTLLFDGHLLLQIPTGQGKSLTFALMAAMAHSFSGVAQHVTVCSRNKLLTSRDYQDYSDFYQYLDIPVVLVRAGDDRNHYQKPTVIYSTTADKSLYDSKLKMVDKITFPPKEQQTVLCDEVDAEWFDNKNTFNFSASNEDPYVNPLEWIYPHLNEFIETTDFRNEHFSEVDDVENVRTFLIQKDPVRYKQTFDRLTDAKLSDLMDAACAAKTLVEKTHFLVRQITREVHGKQETISEAHVLVSHEEDKEATLSHGVQQALHARLNQTYALAIEEYKSTKGAKGVAPFSCDNQIDCIDSQDSRSFFKRYGRMIGCTGTAGTPEELEEVKRELGVRTLLDIPSRRRGQLEYLAPVFAEATSRFFFRDKTQTACIQRALQKARGQPTLISCKDIHQAEAFYAALQKKYGDKVQLIHADNASDPAEFEMRVEKASKPGMITITTPLVARGVDIKTKRAGASQKKLDKLAERLLVIETVLDRYRNRKQLHGRTARDEKRGQTLGIFSLDDIAETYGVRLHKKSRKDKLDALERIMAKLDHEACFERAYSSQVNHCVHQYEAIFDEALQRADDELRPKIIAAKTAFIEQSHRVWLILLADSDPEGQYSNPYLRYNDTGELDAVAMNYLLTTFKTALHQDVYPLCKKELPLPERPPASPSEVLETAALNASKLSTASAVTMDEAYLRHAPETTSRLFVNYKSLVYYQQDMNKRLSFWITDNHKIPEAVKEWTRVQQKSTRDHLSLKGAPIKHFYKAWLQGLTDALGTIPPKVSPKLVRQFLEEQALALTEVALGRPEEVGLDAEKDILQAACDFLATTLTFIAKGVPHPDDRRRITDLIAQLPDLSTMTEFSRVMLLQKVMPLLVATRQQLKSTVAKGYLQALQQPLNIMGYGAPMGSMAIENASAARYSNRLEAIGKRLKARGTKAGFWKDKDLYREKIARFDEYVGQIQRLITYKQSHGIVDIEPEIRALQLRMEHDAVLYKSTARFFKWNSTVTIMKDIAIANKTFLKG